MRNHKPLTNIQLDVIEGELRSSHATGPSMREVSQVVEQARRGNRLAAAVKVLLAERGTAEIELEARSPIDGQKMRRRSGPADIQDAEDALRYFEGAPCSL